MKNQNTENENIQDAEKFQSREEEKQENNIIRKEREGRNITPGRNGSKEETQRR